MTVKSSIINAENAYILTGSTRLLSSYTVSANNYSSHGYLVFRNSVKSTHH